MTSVERCVTLRSADEWLRWVSLWRVVVSDCRCLWSVLRWLWAGVGGWFQWWCRLFRDNSTATSHECVTEMIVQNLYWLTNVFQLIRSTDLSSTPKTYWPQTSIGNINHLCDINMLYFKILPNVFPISTEYLTRHIHIETLIFSRPHHHIIVDICV